MELQESITRENLQYLMTSFYTKAINDDALGPFFIDELGDDINSEDWTEHIDLLADFWLAELLEEKTYRGDFIGAHVKLPYIKNEIFARWLELFSQSADEVYSNTISVRLKKRGVSLSKEFISSLKKI